MLQADVSHVRNRNTQHRCLGNLGEEDVVQIGECLRHSAMIIYTFVVFCQPIRNSTTLRRHILFFKNRNKNTLTLGIEKVNNAFSLSVNESLYILLLLLSIGPIHSNIFFSILLPL